MDAMDLIRQSPVRTYSKGQVIFSEGEVSDTLVIIKNGYVKVASLDAAGIERVLWIASTEDIMPSERLFSLKNRLDYFYTTLSPVTAWTIDKPQLLKEARRSPELMSAIAASLSDTHDDLLFRIDTIDQSTIHDRLVSTLKYLVLRFGGGKTVDLHKIGLQLTHQDIAEMIGSTRETTSLELEKLKHEGSIDYSRSHFIIYPEKHTDLLTY